MGPVAEVQPAGEIDALFLQTGDLAEQRRRVDHHAVADHAIDPRPQDPGRDQRELVGDAIDHDRVAGVRPPLVAHDHVMLIAEEVDDLSLGLVAPLKAHDTASMARLARSHLGQSLRCKENSVTTPTRARQSPGTIRWGLSRFARHACRNGKALIRSAILTIWRSRRLQGHSLEATRAQDVPLPEWSTRASRLRIDLWPASPKDIMLGINPTSGVHAMRHVQRFAVAVLGIGLIAVLLGNATAQGQGSDAALRDRVNQLVERLASDDADRRAEAADSLVKLGPRVLPLLPSSSLKNLEQAKRVEDVRKALAEAARKVNLGASTVTIQGDGIRLTEALKQLQQQSGNIVTDLREQYGEERTNPGMDLDLKETPFFEALDIICKDAGLTPNFYTGDGSIGLMAGSAMMERPDEAPMADRPELKVVYSGPFRIVFQQIAARREFITGADEASARFEVAWEPRLRPMLLALSAEDMEIVDDRGETITPAVQMESGDVVLRPENPVAEINLNMQAPERAAQAAQTVEGQGPGHVARRLAKLPVR